MKYDLVFENEENLKHFIEYFNETLDQFGVISVAQVVMFTGKPTIEDGEHIGWTSVNRPSLDVTYADTGILESRIIHLPDPVSIITPKTGRYPWKDSVEEPDKDEPSLAVSVANLITALGVSVGAGLLIRGVFSKYMPKNPKLLTKMAIGLTAYASHSFLVDKLCDSTEKEYKMIEETVLEVLDTLNIGEDE